MNAPEAGNNHNVWRRLLVVVAISAPIGAISGYFVGRALKRHSLTPLIDWTVADLVSIMIAATLLISAIYAGWATTSTRRWNKMVEKQPADEVIDPETLAAGRRQAAVAAIAGLLIFAPPVVIHIGLGVEGRMAVALAIGGLLVLQSIMNWRIWRSGDELTRAVIAQTGAICFWILQLGLFAWATLTKLNLVADIDSWTLMTVLMAAYLFVSVTISVRRGLVAV